MGNEEDLADVVVGELVVGEIVLGQRGDPLAAVFGGGDTWDRYTGERLFSYNPTKRRVD